MVVLHDEAAPTAASGGGVGAALLRVGLEGDRGSRNALDSPLDDWRVPEPASVGTCVVFWLPVTMLSGATPSWTTTA